ncbi:MAG TPA: HAMP domain-containing sensor histidine kinase [Solirubrobacterales bacterium]|nr:HAMP domain-containing sensor histidine kinase [Solirubrobacterales bacterium]
MAVELAEVAAGLPLAASFALVSGISSLREGRRRSSLNEAMHELRRPLQVLALSLPTAESSGGAVGSSLRLATDALNRLDREINGAAAEEAFSPVPLRPLIDECVRRWKNQAEVLERQLRVGSKSGDPEVEGDRFELSQAMDNLISNALRHGSGQVTVEVLCGGRYVCIRVSDEGVATGRPGGFIRNRTRRHGHGLRVVRRTAAGHGGSFELTRSAEGTVACLRLPLRRVASK